MAVKHMVKCIYCREIFDAAAEPFVKVNERRYAHKECADKFLVPEIELELKEEKDYKKLIQYIKKLLGDSYIEAKVIKQIKDFRETYHYSYSGMLGTLTYWYEVRNAPRDKANGGISIIPYIYQEASRYYQKIAEAEAANAHIKNYRPKRVSMTIPPPQQKKKKVKLFNFEEVKN